MSYLVFVKKKLLESIKTTKTEENITVNVVIFAVVLFSRIQVNPHENFHFSIWLFIVMKTSQKS